MIKEHFNSVRAGVVGERGWRERTRSLALDSAMTGDCKFCLKDSKCPTQLTKHKQPVLSHGTIGLNQKVCLHRLYWQAVERVSTSNAQEQLYSVNTVQDVRSEDESGLRIKILKDFPPTVASRMKINDGFEEQQLLGCNRAHSKIWKLQNTEQR